MDNKSRTPFDPALVETWLEEFRDVPPEEELHHAFSPEFEAKMEALIRHVDSAPRRRSVIVLRRVALIAAIIAALLLTSCAIPAVRQMFKGLFVGINVEDHGVEYRFTYDPEELANAPKYLETMYLPSYIPEGYMISLYSCTPGSITVFWHNEAGQVIHFDQSTYPEDPTDGRDFGLDAEYSEIEWISLGGGEVLRHDHKDYISYYWATDEYRFSLGARKEFSEDELMKIFYSIRANEYAEEYTEIPGTEPTEPTEDR